MTHEPFDNSQSENPVTVSAEGIQTDENGEEIVDASPVKDHDEHSGGKLPVKKLLVDNLNESVVQAEPVGSTEMPAAITREGLVRQDAPALPISPDDQVDLEISSEQSWPFKIISGFVSVCGWCFGFVSLLIALAAISVVPVVQILSLGYFLEVCGRIGRTGKVREGFIGIRKASRIGSIVLGTWILLLPIRYLSTLWYSAQLIEPGSPQTNFLRVFQIVATVMIIAHIVAAWYCGGRLRHFFWPIVAPFSIVVWAMRYIAATPELRRILNSTLGAISPRFVQDFCNVKPITNWFLPAILIKGVVSGDLFTNACDGLWDFIVSLRLRYYFSLGLRGFLTSIVWLIVPAMLLIGATSLTDGAAILCGLFGVPLMIIVIIYLPFAQAHFAAEGKWSAMFDVRGIRRAFVRAPIRFWLALFFLLALALPLFLFQIEKTYEELEWIESLVFMVFMLPARFLVGWAYARGRHREQKSSWLLTWPVRFAQLPVAAIFVFFLFVSRYTAMNGVWSIFDQPAFLVPAPFTEWPF